MELYDLYMKSTLNWDVKRDLYKIIRFIVFIQPPRHKDTKKILISI